MGRSPMSDEGAGVKKGPWTPEEDDKLINHIQKHGHGSWRALPRLAGLNRCGKSCRLRWTNYLRPDIKRGKFSQDEEQTILNLHAILGNKWSAIATHLPGRTDNEIKNFWNTHLKKKLIQMGFDPMTHRPRTDIFATLPHLLALASLFDNPSSWEDQSSRVLRLNQCLLQNLLHPSASSIPANFTNPDFNCFKDFAHDLDPPPPQLSAAEFVQFSHMPELQEACSVDPSPMCSNGAGAMVQGSEFSGVLRDGEGSPPWMQQSLSQSPPPPAVAPVNENPIANAVDACSGSAQMWRELLELDDPIFQENLM